MRSLIMLSEVIARASPNTPAVRTQLEAELRAWWKEEQEDWDAQITGDTTDSDLWTGMPCVDSKTVARMAPISRSTSDDSRCGTFAPVDTTASTM